MRENFYITILFNALYIIHIYTHLQFWEVRQLRLEAVREQLSSVPVLSILHNLEMVRSTYAQCFSLAQHDIAQALQEAVHCLAFLRTLQPWLLRLHDAQHPDTMISSFAPITATLLLVWQHSGYDQIYMYPPPLFVPLVS